MMSPEEAPPTGRPCRLPLLVPKRYGNLRAIALCRCRCSTFGLGMVVLGDGLPWRGSDTPLGRRTLVVYCILFIDLFMYLLIFIYVIDDYDDARRRTTTYDALRQLT